MPLSPTDLSGEKAALRAHLRQARRETSPEEHAQLSATLVKKLSAHPYFLSAHTILLYYPLAGEPDLLPLVEIAFSLGKRVAFPISDPKTCTLSFRLVSSLSKLSQGAYGILEPPKDASPIETDPSTLCVVPALSFDRFGFRLGYGKGFYDRFLSDFPGKSVGLIDSRLLSDILPRDEYDQRVDLIITEREEWIPHEINESTET